MKLWDFFREVFSSHGKDTVCRCCEDELDKVGGYGMAILGSGFCRVCRDKILSGD